MLPVEKLLHMLRNAGKQNDGEYIKGIEGRERDCEGGIRLVKMVAKRSRRVVQR